jgi:hypothetical protein
VKRITVWIDCQDRDVESVRERVEAFLRSLKVEHTILSGYNKLIIEDSH